MDGSDSHRDESSIVPQAEIQPARVRFSETAEVHVRTDGSKRVIPITDASKPAVPESLKHAWRDSLDALADELNVTTTVIVQITREGLRVLVCDTSPDNPYHEGCVSPLGDGRYCEAVIGIDDSLSVTDAGSSAVWRDSPDAALGIKSYFGVPIHWSDGSFFGSLCVLDRRARIAETKLGEKVDALRQSIEADLESLLRENSRAEIASFAEAMDAMFRYAPGGIFSYSAEADERFSFISVNMLSFLGYTEEEFRGKFENRFSLMVWHEDRERVLAEIDEQISHGSFDTCEYRIEKGNGGIVWVHDEGHIVTDENGKRWFFVVIVDITDTLDEQQRLITRNKELEGIVRTRQSTLDDIPGGVRVFKKWRGDIICVNANKYYADMIGVEKDSLIGETFDENAKRIHPDDRARHRVETVENLDLHRSSEGTYRFLNAKTGLYRWYHVEVALRTQPDGNDLAYFHYTDVDDLKSAEDELQTDQKRIELAVKGAHLAVWEYDIATKQMVIPEGMSGDFTRAHYGFSDCIIENVPESTLPLMLADEDCEHLLALYDEIRSGSEYATADIWFKRSPEAKPCCDRFTYYVEKDESGIPVRAYGIGADITAQKQEQTRFHQSIQTILSANPAALCTFQINLTKDVCYEGHGISSFILKTLRSDTASGLFGKCLGIIPYEKDRRLFHSVFDRDALIAGFAEGKASRHIDYRRVDESCAVHWVRTFVSLLRNPESDDIEGAIYSIDISHEKRRDEVFEMLVGEEYDLIALLDLETGKVEALHLSDPFPEAYRTTFRAAGDVCDHGTMRENALKVWAADDDRQKYFEGTDLARIRQALDHEGRYELTVKGEIPARGTVYHKLQHYYLDDEKREVLMADADITQSYLAQQNEMEEKRRAQLERTLVDTVNSLPASSGLFRIQDDRSIIPDRYSDEFFRMGGYTHADQFFQDNAYTGVHPDDIDRLMRTISDHLDGNAPFSAIYRIITKSGDYKWVSVNFNQFSFGDTNYLYAVYTYVDELKRQEKQLADQYDAAQEYLDSVASTYLSTGRVNLTRNIVEESSANGLLTDDDGERSSYDLLISRLLAHVINESDRENCARIFDRKNLIDACARGERSCAATFQMRSTDGRICWIKDTVNLTKHPNTGDVILFGAASDVTHEELTRAIMDRVLPRQYDYVSCIDEKRNEVVFFASGSDFLNGLGIEAGSCFLDSERAYCERYVLPADRERYMEYMNPANITASLRAGARHVDSFAIQEDAGQRIVQVEFFQIDPDSGLLATARIDITDVQKRQLEQEEALRKALAAAESANAAKSEFLSRMSHDMRTPLNGIIGITYLTEEMEMSDEVHENLVKIDTSSKFLLGLINDILDMTKAESNEVELHPEPYPPTEFNEYLDAVIKPLCDDKRLNFVVNANQAEDAVPLFDKLRINQVIFNLLSNAVKFTPEGGTVSYDVHFDKRDEHGCIPLRITVSDNGIGMTEEFLQVLFEPFTQEERADVSASRGTGLGLAIVKRLVNLMGGTISVKSAVGIGTTFTIDMIVDSIAMTDPMLRADADGTPRDSASLAGRHILLCEDHPLNQEIAVALLSEKGAIVEVADNGQTGVDLFAKSSIGFYDAVLMDIRMPVMDGYQATAKIRELARPDAASVPIIAMTADAFADDVARCLAVGMNDHIAKPIDPEGFLDTLLHAFSRRNSQ